MSLRTISFVDTFPLCAVLYRLRAVFDSEAAKDGEGHNRILPLTNALLKDKNWNAAKAATAKGLNALAPLNKGVRPELVSISIEKLMPQGWIPWSKSDETTLTFHIPIVTNGACNLYSGLASGHFPVGVMVQASTDVLHSATNFGETPRYHLILEVKKPDDSVTVQ